MAKQAIVVLFSRFPRASSFREPLQVSRDGDVPGKPPTELEGRSFWTFQARSRRTREKTFQGLYAHTQPSAVYARCTDVKVPNRMENSESCH